MILLLVLLLLPQVIRRGSGRGKCFSFEIHDFIPPFWRQTSPIAYLWATAAFHDTYINTVLPPHNSNSMMRRRRSKISATQPSPEVHFAKVVLRNSPSLRRTQAILTWRIAILRLSFTSSPAFSIRWIRYPVSSIQDPVSMRCLADPFDGFRHLDRCKDVRPISD